MADGQLAVLIDFENVGLESIRPLLDELSDEGRIIIRRAYADWTKAASKRDQLLQLGLDPIQVFHSSSTSKNAADIRLAIDAIDLLHRSPVDTFVVVSSDTDFVPLVMALRAAGKRVIGAGHRAVVSHTLVTSCDRYILLGEREEKVAVSRSPRRGGAKQQPVVSVGPSEAREDGVSLLLRALHAAMDYEGKVSGSRLHQAMTRIDPSFDFRALGYRTFAGFMEGTGMVTLTRTPGQGDVLVELKGGAPSVPSPRPAEAAVPLAEGAGQDDRWAQLLEAALDARAHETGRNQVSGAWTADQAAKILEVPSLKASKYRNLKNLLEADERLRRRWTQVGSYVVRREQASEAAPADGSPQPQGAEPSVDGVPDQALGQRGFGSEEPM